MRKQNIKNNYLKVKQQIEEFSGKYRNKEKIDLVVVSKYANIEQIEILLQEGHRDFGENRVLEGSSKWEHLKQRYSGVKLHLIGKLQSNKVKEAVKSFDVIHSVDSIKLLTQISEEAKRQNVKTPKCYIQVNIAEEPQKSGVKIAELLEIVSRAKQLGLEIEGLMCIPPQGALTFPYFAMMKNLANQHNLKCLSQGMSEDFETAIKFGATIVRIGSKIFEESATS